MRGRLLHTINSLALSVTAYAVPHSPFCRYATSSPGRGKSFLKGRGLGKEMKFAWTAKGSPFGRAGKSKGFD